MITLEIRGVTFRFGQVSLMRDHIFVGIIKQHYVQPQYTLMTYHAYSVWLYLLPCVCLTIEIEWEHATAPDCCDERGRAGYEYMVKEGLVKPEESKCPSTS